MLTSLGSLRRILKLLYARVRPVFVFDGGAPVLKRKTLLARSKRRQRAEFGLEETARQLLQNQLQQQAALAVVKSREPSFNAPREDVRSDHGVTVVPEDDDASGEDDDDNDDDDDDDDDE